MFWIHDAEAFRLPFEIRALLGGSESGVDALELAVCSVASKVRVDVCSPEEALSSRHADRGDEAVRLPLSEGGRRDTEALVDVAGGDVVRGSSVHLKKKDVMTEIKRNLKPSRACKLPFLGCKEVSKYGLVFRSVDQ